MLKNVMQQLPSSLLCFFSLGEPSTSSEEPSTFSEEPSFPASRWVVSSGRSRLVAISRKRALSASYQFQVWSIPLLAFTCIYELAFILSSVYNYILRHLISGWSSANDRIYNTYMSGYRSSDLVPNHPFANFCTCCLKLCSKSLSPKQTRISVPWPCRIHKSKYRFIAW